MYSVNKQFEFESCHKLILDYGSPCTNLHGHSYKISIQLFSDTLDKNGMVIDFSKMKRIKDWVMNYWDHSLILSEKDTDLQLYERMTGIKLFKFPYDNVTAELLASHLCKLTEEQILPRLRDRLKKIKIMVWETSNNFASFEKEFKSEV